MVDFVALSPSLTAAACGVSRQTIHAWATRGAPRNGDGTYHLPRLIDWRLKELIAEAEPATGGLDRTSAERYRAAKAELAEIKLAQERGELLGRPAVLAWALQLAQGLRSGLEGMAMALAGELQGRPAPQIAEVLEGRFADLRRRLTTEAGRGEPLKLPAGPAERFAELLGDIGGGRT